jgi:pimeloyl-ACP methyl ester carboxylesterase
MRRVLLAVLLVALLTAACSDDDSPSMTAGTTAPATSTTLPAYEPKLTERDCGYDPPLQVRTTCSWLEVPENRAAPDGRKVKLPVVVLHSPSKQPLPDPVVYLEGGPGGDVVDSARGWEDDPRLAERDIILWDQRGTGLAEPNLNCPEVDEAILNRFKKVAPYDEELAERQEAYRQCRSRLVGEGIDLAQYTSETSAADLADLRTALGIDEWNLLGVSYGTRLALTAMRSHPEGIRSVLLDSVYPTTVGGAQRGIASGQRAFDQLAAGCAASTTCTEKYGDVSALIQKAFDQLNDEPFRGEVDLGSDIGTIPLEIDGYDALGGLFTALYDHELIPALPGIIQAIANGDYAIIPAIAQQGIPFVTQFADGMSQSVDCADSGGLDLEGTDAARRDPGKWAVVVSEEYPTYCDVWDVPFAPASYNEPVRSELPALVMAGKYDPVTPPGDSRAAAEALANATYVEIDGIGHGVIFSNPCGSDIYDAFLAAPTEKPDTACAPGQPPPAFA